MSLRGVARLMIVAAPTVLGAGLAIAAGFSLDIPPSAATAGRGGAGTAAFWSADLDDWSNPALLGYVQGMDYRWTTTLLLPQLTSDIRFRTHRLAMGGGGIGVNFASATVDYGVTTAADPGGAPTGTFRPTESADPIGAGLSLSRLTAAISALRGAPTPTLARYVDVAAGFSAKSLTIALAPSFYVGGSATARVRDFGWLLRVNPVPRTDAGRAFVETAFGHASLNYDDASIVFVGEDMADLVVKQHRDGAALRLGFPLRLGAARGPVGWIVRGMDPYLTVSVTADHVRHENPGYEVDAVGGEIDLGALVTGRIGHVTDRGSDIDGFSYGVGIGLPLARFMGLRYDFASYPEATGQSHLHRHGVGAWFDLIALARQ